MFLRALWRRHVFAALEPAAVGMANQTQRRPCEAGGPVPLAIAGIHPVEQPDGGGGHDGRLPSRSPRDHRHQLRDGLQADDNSADAVFVLGLVEQASQRRATAGSVTWVGFHGVGHDFRRFEQDFRRLELDVHTYGNDFRRFEQDFRRLELDVHTYGNDFRRFELDF